MMSSMLIDAHTHPQFPAYDADRDQVIRRAQEAGVKMIAVGTNAATSEAAIRLAERYTEDVWATVGFHPSHAMEGSWHHDPNEQKEAAPEQFDIEKLRLIAAHPKVVAIGECGLDYYRIMKHETRIMKQQHEVFSEQIRLAQELKKPLMVHCRPSSAKATEGKPSRGTDDAYEDLLSLIPNSQFLIPKIVHFYVGSSLITKKLLDAGFYFTFGGVITFSRDYDSSLNLIPLDRLLLETDAPYVAPEPHRGTRNEPAYVIEVAKKLAEIKGITYTEVQKTTMETAQRLFGI